MKKDIPIFMCSKCEHRLYLSGKNIKKLLNYDCPECGEESYELWIFKGFSTEDEMNEVCDEYIARTHSGI